MTHVLAKWLAAHDTVRLETVFAEMILLRENIGRLEPLQAHR
jgi:hypothetical protein